MSKSCKGLAMELVKCLSETDCVKVSRSSPLPHSPPLFSSPRLAVPPLPPLASFRVQNRPYKECAGEKVPCITSECVGLRETYFNCKRGQASLQFARLRLVSCP
ncbi:hypothetical protein QYE76_006692 [Lolium multiflorum]|uniref:Uncharacterized protein n=1 Tax=Lolium multiflorum TaxID=4521 RepID=A0AAD8RWS2_LOLMU|nr:hypothetical protein QYE76_006692 [Lolium multiflorum]